MCFFSLNNISSMTIFMPTLSCWRDGDKENQNYGTNRSARGIPFPRADRSTACLIGERCGGEAGGTVFCRRCRLVSLAPVSTVFSIFMVPDLVFYTEPDNGDIMPHNVVFLVDNLPVFPETKDTPAWLWPLRSTLLTGE